MPLGDVTDYSKIKIQGLESFKSVDPPIQNPIRGSFQRSIEQFNSKHQLPWINSASYNQRKDFNANNPSFIPTDTRASAGVIYSVPNKAQSNINSRNNPVELSSATLNDEINAERSYDFQTVLQEQNPLDFKWTQMSSNNLAQRLVRNKGGMHAANVHRSGSLGYQNISKSEMHSDSSRPLGLNEPYLRENIPTNYMSRSSTVNHNTRHKSDGNMLLDHFLQNKGQNQNVLRRVAPANTSPLIGTANQQTSQPLSQAFSAGTGITSQISYENMRDVALSKVFKPPTIPTPISIAFKRSNIGHSMLPLIKSRMFYSQDDHIKLSNSERVASPKANLQSNFEYGNTKSATSSYTFKNNQLTQNRGQSNLNVLPIQTFPNQKKYDNLATGISAIRPSVINNSRSYFLSDQKSGIQMSALLKRSKQNTDLTSQMQFAKNTMLFSERDKNIHLPDPTNYSLRKPGQQNTQNRMHLNSFGQSTVPSLSVKRYPAPSLVPGYTTKSVHSVSSSVSGTQGASKNSGTSSSQNRPYYLTSKKPYAFKGFTFVPTLQTSLQKSEIHSGQKPLLKSSSNVQYAPARPHTAQSALTQKPLIREDYKKTLFQFKDIASSREKQHYWDQSDSFDNGPQRETFSTKGASNPMSDALNHHVLRGQAVAMKTSLSGTNTKHNGAVDEVQSKTSQRWTSSRLAQHSESNQDEFPAVRFPNGAFIGSNLKRASIKSSNSHKSPTSELIHPIQKSSLMNKVTGYPQIHKAIIQPLRRYSLKEREGVLNPTKEIKARNSAGKPQSNTSENYSPIRSRPTSSIVIGRQVEVTQERKSSEKKSNHRTVYAIPNSQSEIYRYANINSHKTSNSAKLTFPSLIHRSAMKPSGKANIPQANAASYWRNKTSQISEADISLSAVGVSQALRPTSSFVVGKYINTFDKTSTKSNLNMSSTKSGLNNYKPVWFADIAGSASFTDVKPHSADSTTKEEVDQNGTNSTSGMERSFKELVIDSFSMISALQNEMDESAVDSRVPELMPTAAIDFTTQSKLSFTEGHARPQPTVYSSEFQPVPENHTTPIAAEDIDPLYEGTVIPSTTLLVKMTSG